MSCRVWVWAAVVQNGMLCRDNLRCALDHCCMTLMSCRVWVWVSSRTEWHVGSCLPALCTQSLLHEE